MSSEMILISILSISLALMAMFPILKAHRMEHTCLNSSDLQEYATRLKILMIGILLFLEHLLRGLPQKEF